MMDKKYFQAKIDAHTDAYFDSLKTAPDKGGFDGFFKRTILSKFQLQRAWATAVKDIMTVAKVYGVTFNTLAPEVPEAETLSEKLDDLG